MSASATARRSRQPRRLENSRLAGRLAVVGLAVFSARLRWDRLGASGLYLDDAWVATSIRFHGFGDLLRIGSTSPGFVLFLLRPWVRLFGSSVTALQLLPFVLGVIGPPLCFVLARRWKTRFGPSVLAGVLLAIAPVDRIYSTNLKQYTAEAVATLLLLWGGSRVIAEPTNRRYWIYLVIGGVAATVLSMSEAVVVLAVLGGAAIAAEQRGHSRMPRLGVAAIEAYAFFAVVWYALALKPHLNSVLYTFWHAKFIHIDRGLATLPGQVIARVNGLLAGFSGMPTWVTLLVVGVLALAVLIPRPAVGFMLVAPTAFALMLAAGHIAPLGTGRTDIYLYPTLALVVAMGVDELIRAAPRSLVKPAGVVTLLMSCLILVTARPGLPAYPSENVKPLVQIVERERVPGDLTLIYPMASFGYGLATKSAVRLQVDNRYPMSFFVAPEDTHARVLPMERKTPQRYAPFIDRTTRGRQRVWLLGAHIWPDWQAVRTLLREQGFRVQEYHVTSDAMLILYARS